MGAAPVGTAPTSASEEAPVTEPARSRMGAAPIGTTPTSASEEAS
ncbi:hypothetical protein ACU610_06905 [Geodermatophilus sp. URMC 61]